MAKLPIKKFNDPILREKCEKVEKIDSKIRNLIDDMTDTMYENYGIGLAGPQVGVKKRIVVAQPDLSDFPPLVLINPKITKKSREKTIEEEGCLSFPGIFLKIKRPKEVEVEALNREGKKIKLKTEGILARVVQHEIDHLNGILFFNRLNFFQKIIFKITHPKIKGVFL